MSDPGTPSEEPKGAGGFDVPTPTPVTPSNPTSGDQTKPPVGDGGQTNGFGTPTEPVAPTVATQQAVDGAPSVMNMAANPLNQLAQQATPLPQVSLQLKAIDQQERHEFDADYTASIAVSRTYRPQGFFGLSEADLANLPKSAFLEVDTNSEFWRMFDVAVHGPAADDFAQFGLSSAVVQIDYGDPNGGTNHVGKSVRFNSPTDAATVQSFKTPTIAGYDAYAYGTTYVYDGSWTGDPAQRSVGPTDTTTRDVFVIPRRDFRFVTINAAFTSPPDWTKLSQIHLAITCRTNSPDTPESFSKTVVMHSGWIPSFVPPDPQQTAPPLPWRIRFKDAALTTAISIDVQPTYVGVDGSSTIGKLVTTTDPNLVLAPRA